MSRLNWLHISPGDLQSMYPWMSPQLLFLGSTLGCHRINPASMIKWLCGCGSSHTRLDNGYEPLSCCFSDRPVNGIVDGDLWGWSDIGALVHLLLQYYSPTLISIHNRVLAAAGQPTFVTCPRYKVSAVIVNWRLSAIWGGTVTIPLQHTRYS